MDNPLKQLRFVELVIIGCRHAYVSVVRKPTIPFKLKMPNNEQWDISLLDNCLKPSIAKYLHKRRGQAKRSSYSTSILTISRLLTAGSISAAMDITIRA
jgi:hypothetical protein